MDSAINLNAIYDKNLSFLIGSGASSGLLPTLAVGMRTADNSRHTIETIATALPENDARRAALWMYYYDRCIRPAQKLSREEIAADQEKQSVISNYRRFVGTVLYVLSKRRPLERRCNVFTTNYDLCFPLVADEILEGGGSDFILNDGSRGYRTKHLEARNFNTYVCQTGIFERDQIGIPQINLIHLHGAVYWKKHASGIVLDYDMAGATDLLTGDDRLALREFSRQLDAPETGLENLVTPNIPADVAETFLAKYRELPIVNPTKWKFYETVFEEHYYQMLRLLSYELEKPNSVLVTFGFSFADEHILNLVKRSLANPKLQVFVCCFNADEGERLRPHFEMHPNVRFVGSPDHDLDFNRFNSTVFSLQDALPDESLPARPLEGEEE